MNLTAIRVELFSLENKSKQIKRPLSAAMRLASDEAVEWPSEEAVYGSSLVPSLIMPFSGTSPLPRVSCHYGTLYCSHPGHLPRMTHTPHALSAISIKSRH